MYRPMMNFENVKKNISYPCKNDEHLLEHICFLELEGLEEESEVYNIFLFDRIIFIYWTFLLHLLLNHPISYAH